MTSSGIISSLGGGLLIGLAAILLLIANGKIAGISGMIGRLWPLSVQTAWRPAFIAGLIAGGLLLRLVHVLVFVPLETRSMAALIAAGLLVGFGTQIGSGCTSGHGVCGIGRGSLRSVVATLVFMATGAATVFVIRHFCGGSL